MIFKRIFQTDLALNHNHNEVFNAVKSTRLIPGVLRYLTWMI